ncbi:MAG: DUF4389 domain-containing protein [Acidimicrobiales bacterium]|nr:DUF4389 domain-containing protein [Acidimicrobiales bacterium]
MTDPTSPAAPPRRAGPPVARIIMTVLGALLVLAALPLGALGGVLTWAHATQRDSDGFFTSDTGRIETLTHAVISEEIDLGSRPGPSDRRFDLGDLATVRLTADPLTDEEVFIGIGPENDVERYLDDVSHAEITDLDVDPFRATYRTFGGDAPDEPPGAETFWAAQAEGDGTQTLEWDLESGDWTVVIMNADGSDGVGVEASAGVKLDWLLGLGIGMLVAAAVLGIIGVVLLVVGAAGLGTHAPVSDHVPGTTPVRLEARLDEPLSRWLWLVKWFLLIPHVLVLIVLWLAFFVVTVVAFFAILFTGRYPRSLFDFNVGVMRWGWRVGYYSYSALGTDRYPPFTLGPAPDYPATLEVAYPAQLSRGLVLVKWWLLAIPHYVVLGIIGGGLVGSWQGDEGGYVGGPGLIAWLVLVAAVVLLFVGRYPRGIFAFVVGLNRWIYRVVAYAALMTDEYPPFRLDQGGPEPVREAAAEPGPDRPTTDVSAGVGAGGGTAPGGGAERGDDGGATSG